MSKPGLFFSQTRLRHGLYATYLAIPAMLSVSAIAQAPVTGWGGYSANAQHTSISPNAAQSLKKIKWQTPVDLQPPYSGNSLLIHYGSPVITAANTVIFPVRTGRDSSNIDRFRVEARRGSNGTLLWKLDSGYSLPPYNWIPSYGITLTPTNRLCFPEIGGIVRFRNNPDQVNGGLGVWYFYEKAEYYRRPKLFKDRVRISTPITSDASGNIYFGYIVTDGDPITLANGTVLKSGIARISAGGKGSFVSAATASGDSAMTRVPLNCAPAISNDGKTVYVAVSNRQGFGAGYLLALNSTTLAQTGKVRLKDVKSPSRDAYIPDDGTAAPTVGPDGDVYYGVLENPFGQNHARGWLLHFNSDLTTAKTPGSFGWDDTASIVPASMVPSYKGSSSYLVITKYNDYAGFGDGQNRVGVLDPNATQTHFINGATVMKDVLTALGPTPDDEHIANYPKAVREWCINSAAVDPKTKSIMVNCEDGKLYRWDMTQQKFTEVVTLTPGIGEAYTPTVIGPDGTVYAINEATLFAVGE